VLLNYDNLRYRLLPYIYSLAGKVTQDQYTMMRALAFDWRQDTAVYSIKDEYMFGPAFLVNPVSTPGATSRSVYLPGGEWYDFWTGKRLAGGVRIEAAAPVSTMPLYVRAGSIVPMGPEEEYATQKPLDTLELRVYPGADGSFTLYEDENEGYGYEQGAFATINIAWRDKLKNLVISGQKGSFPGMLKKRVFNIVIVGEGVGAGEAAAKGRIVHYTGLPLIVAVGVKPAPVK
jgi:alpha-D-xyloside xylohydrolase